MLIFREVKESQGSAPDSGIPVTEDIKVETLNPIQQDIPGVKPEIKIEPIVETPKSETSKYVS